MLWKHPKEWKSSKDSDSNDLSSSESDDSAEPSSGFSADTASGPSSSSLPSSLKAGLASGFTSAKHGWDLSDQFSVPWQPRSHVTRRLSFFVPLHYTAEYAYPLVVWLHSDGFNEHQIDQVMPHISVRNYVGVGVRGVRAADSVGHRFDWPTSPASIAAAHEAVCHAVDSAMDRFSVHPKRVILAGFETGATMALRIAMRQPDRFAGAVAMGGRLPQGGIRNVSQLRDRRLPMLWQWAHRNPRFDHENLQRDIRWVMPLGCNVEIRQYPDETEMVTTALRDIDHWIMGRIVAGSTISDGDLWATSPSAYSSN